MKSFVRRRTAAEREGDEEVVWGGGEDRECETDGGGQCARHGAPAEPELLGKRGRHHARQPPGYHEGVEEHCHGGGGRAPLLQLRQEQDPEGGAENRDHRL